nr:probable inorganic phosphate transporter 1-9 [Tanacetum cinerariifolium]
MVFVSLGFFRFVLGIGIGGDYPLSATIMSEFANKRTRGAFIAGVFSMQGSPNFGEHRSGPEADVAWRLILMIGVIPASMTCYWRLKMPETARFTALVEKNTLQAAKDMEKVMNVSLSTIREDVEMMDTPNTRAAFSNTYPFFSREFFRRHGRDLAAASINWFLIDIVFYSLNLFQYHAFKGKMTPKSDMNIYDDAWQVAKFQALVAAGATIPGYFVTVYMIDYVGRVKIQAAGFFFMAVSLFTIAKVNKGGWGSNPGTGFIILYGLTFFFCNFGPNTTTFIVPAELFPARFRATCHGISGAFGKVGAIVGTLGFLWVSRDTPNGQEVSDVLRAMGGVCVLGFFVTYFFTRETTGRSLEENENVDEFTGVCFIRFWPNKEDQHSYDVQRNMQKVIVFQTWLSKFSISLDQLLDLEALTLYLDTVDVEDQQMIFQQLMYNLVAMIKNFVILAHKEIMSDKFVFDMRTIRLRRLHMPAILPGRVFDLKEIDCFLHLVMDEALDVVAVVGDTLAINSSKNVLS